LTSDGGEEGGDIRVFWELESGEERNREHPDTFEIPPRERRERLSVGEAAQLMFRIRIEEADDPEKVLDDGTERMWVIVVGRRKESYLGLLDSQPMVLAPESGILDVGTALEFLPEHVINISTPPREYLERKYPAHFHPTAGT
jgi:hypothetical protein